MVSSQTNFRGGAGHAPLGHADTALQSGSAAWWLPAPIGRPRRGRGAAPVAGPLPDSYVHPAEKYILVQEPDKRFRLVGLAPEAKVTLLEHRELQAGADNRVRITNTTTWPHSVHGHCIITYPDTRQYIGSGTMVNRHHVITAGHVVYSKANGGWATSIQFNAAQNDGTLPYGSAFATFLFSFKGWTDSQNRDYDTGMLILNRDLGNQTGWMGLITTSDGNLSNHQVTVEGYPGERAASNFGRQQGRSSASLIIKSPTTTIPKVVTAEPASMGPGRGSLWSTSAPTMWQVPMASPILEADLHGTSSIVSLTSGSPSKLI